MGALYTCASISDPPDLTKGVSCPLNNNNKSIYKPIFSKTNIHNYFVPIIYQNKPQTITSFQLQNIW